MSQRQMAMGLAAVAVVLLVYAALNFGLDVGNKKAVVAVLVAGVASTIAAYSWARQQAPR